MRLHHEPPHEPRLKPARRPANKKTVSSTNCWIQFFFTNHSQPVLVDAEEEPDNLGHEDQEDSGDGLGGSVVGRYAVILGDFQEGAQGRCRGHGPGGGSQCTEERKLEDIIGHEEAQDGGEEGDHDAGEEELDAVFANDFHKARAGVGACSHEEEGQTQVTDELHVGLLVGEVDGADVAEVAQDDAGDDGAAACTEGDDDLIANGELQSAEDSAEGNGHGDAEEAVGFKVHQLMAQGLRHILGFRNGQLLILHVPVSAHKLGKDLDQENHAQNAESISNTIAHAGQGGVGQ